jgi:hypothetical protein
MDDEVKLSASQKKIVTIIQRHAQRIIDEELRKHRLSIRERMAAIETRVDTELQAQIARLDEAIERAEAEPKHEGMML